MSTETKTDNTTTPANKDNKTVFGPLGKYAMVAVIMVSIIVTTAIMLDKQLKNADEQIAVIKNKVTEMTTAEDTSTDESVGTAAGSEIKQAETAKEVVVETVAVATEVPVVEETTAEASEAATAEKQTAQETIATPVATKTKQKTAATVAAPLDMAKTENAAQARHEQLVKENQARIEAYKLEQKKHMTEVFARIKSLESQQLDRYKAEQDEQIVRLREQISQQQQMIETLVSRNKKLFEMRAASMQHRQDEREQVLNRI